MKSSDIGKQVLSSPVIKNNLKEKNKNLALQKSFEKTNRNEESFKSLNNKDSIEKLKKYNKDLCFKPVINKKSVKLAEKSGTTKSRLLLSISSKNLESFFETPSKSYPKNSSYESDHTFFTRKSSDRNTSSSINLLYSKEKASLNISKMYE